MDLKPIARTDPEVAGWIAREEERLSLTLEMIASENVVSEAVLAATGSVLTNKYAEGYPGRRYYGGCRFVDEVERLAIERARELFGVEYANVQPHSGTQANMAVILSLLQPGDRIMGMSLDSGGHLSHGARANFSGRLFENHPYTVDRKSERLDYDAIARLAAEVKPKLIICGASAYPRIIDFARFREIADGVGACLMADIAHIAGLVIAGLHPSPVGQAHFVTSTTHKTMRGPRGGLILSDRKHGQMLDRMIFPGIQGGPLMHVIAAKAVSLHEALQPAFKDYQRQIVRNCRVLAESLLEKGFRLVTGGTDNHLVLIDLTNRRLTGRQAEDRLEATGISCNKNMIPFDPLDPKTTSGLRLGTPAITSRGMKEPEMRLIAGLIDRVLREPAAVKPETIRREVEDLCRKFPLPVS
ncbi:MAG TPA: serine hydroxymethyltransferase [bacterium]|uniref:Serine hydroxymethyltransferase n=1 Tax=candidate division TA06 bacterium ADurb.Bin417 TaxID=1852828 RepID=A0A1V5MDB1_UNCT6|nr:MAG: Serine hydroxymethyltransferase [candidate division TA06 bacterium ADurb.Bin417]HNS49351.1 serine hydroxymethyltransferase [bacterium]